MPEKSRSTSWATPSVRLGTGWPGREFLRFSRQGRPRRGSSRRSTLCCSEETPRPGPSCVPGSIYCCRDGPSTSVSAIQGRPTMPSADTCWSESAGFSAGGTSYASAARAGSGTSRSMRGGSDRPSPETTETESRACPLVKPVREPDAGNLQVRFDERWPETERWSKLRHRRLVKAASNSTSLDLKPPRPSPTLP